MAHSSIARAGAAAKGAASRAANATAAKVIFLSICSPCLVGAAIRSPWRGWAVSVVEGLAALPDVERLPGPGEGILPLLLRLDVAADAGLAEVGIVAVGDVGAEEAG